MKTPQLLLSLLVMMVTCADVSGRSKYRRSAMEQQQEQEWATALEQLREDLRTLERGEDLQQLRQALQDVQREIELTLQQRQEQGQEQEETQPDDDRLTRIKEQEILSREQLARAEQQNKEKRRDIEEKIASLERQNGDNEDAKDVIPEPPPTKDATKKGSTTNSPGDQSTGNEVAPTIKVTVTAGEEGKTGGDGVISVTLNGADEKPKSSSFGSVD